MRRTKEVRETSVEKRDNYIHVETRGCIVNIYPSLTNLQGRSCTTVEVLKDEHYEFDCGGSVVRVAQVVPKEGA